MTSDFMTPYALHKRWGGAISPKTLANWRAKNIGPQWKKVGGRVVYALSDVIAYESRPSTACAVEFNSGRLASSMRNE